MTELAASKPARGGVSPLSVAQDLLLLVVAGLFFTAYGRDVVETPSVTGLGLAVEQALLVWLFLTRRRSRATSTRLFDWVVASGSWLTLLLRPADPGFTYGAALGTATQVAGLAVTCIAFFYLGRSFGIVAANRGLKINGPYRFVRHPVYVGHTITATGFVIANPSALNLTLLVLVTVCQVLRIRAEERLLTETDEYAAYAARVRWRLVPGLY